MKVGIDVSNLNKLSVGRGIGFYAKYLYESLVKYSDIEIKLIENETNEKFDVLHYPYFDFFFNSLKIKDDQKTVVTIHDVTPLVFPKHYPSGIKGMIHLFKQKRELRKVSKIITDSEYSKYDIHKVLGIPLDKIEVIYLATDTEYKKISDKKFLKKIQEKLNIPEHFILYGGSTNWNKNLLNQVKACVETENHIVLVGAGFEEKENLNHPELKVYKEFLEKYSQSDFVHILGFVETGDLVALYNLAEIVLFASFYEGFGLPILQAQICETPIITSRTSSMPEIGGKGVVYVNPEEIENIKKAIKQILENSELRKELIIRGSENVKRFSWKKTAADTIRVYEKILNEHT